MVNNFANINKTNNHLSPQLVEHTNDHDIWRWKSSPELGQTLNVAGSNRLIGSQPSPLDN